MSTITVKEGHGLASDEVKSRLGQFEQDIAKYGMKLNWNGDSAKIDGTGASGEIKVAPADVTVIVKLGMMAKMAGIKPDKLEASMRKRLQAALA